MTSKNIFCTSVGKKFLVALTGLFMVFFVVGHLLGNLNVFLGPDAINEYAAFLKSIPKVIWGFRIALLLSIAVHIWLTIDLTKTARAAKPIKYQQSNVRKASFSSRFMLISGLTILAFVAYHLAHYTFGLTDPDLMNLHDDQGRHHVYNMMVMGFSHPLVSGFYMVAQAFLGFHLSHGVSSAARTLGLSDRNLFSKIHKGGIVFAVLVSALFISIPLAVLGGFLTLQ